MIGIHDNPILCRKTDEMGDVAIHSLGGPRGRNLSRLASFLALVEGEDEEDDRFHDGEE
jgi:hypothetical protein